jgi:putative lipoprotein
MSQKMKNFLAVLGAMAILALAQSGHALGATITGEVTYSERLALPEGGRLIVRLVDLSQNAAPTPVEAEAMIQGPGHVPLQFTLNFNPVFIDPTHAYGLVAEIRAGNALWFRNGAEYRVDPLAPAAPIVIVVSFVGRQIAPSLPEASLFGIVWRVTAIGEIPIADGFEANLSIAEDGRAGGNGGCNNYFTQSRIDGKTLDFSAIASTRMACSPEAMRTESAYFNALESVKAYVIDKDSLFLLDATGRKAATLTKAVAE